MKTKPLFKVILPVMVLWLSYQYLGLYFGNQWLLLTGRGYFIPAESSVFDFITHQVRKCANEDDLLRLEIERLSKSIIKQASCPLCLINVLVYDKRCFQADTLSLILYQVTKTCLTLGLYLVLSLEV